MNDRNLLFFQVDAVPHQVFESLLKSNSLPKTKKWLDENSYQVSKYYSSLPSSTFAFQTQLFFRTKRNIPSYRWFDKNLNKIISAENGPSVKLFEKTYLGNIRDPFQNGISINGIFDLHKKSQSLASENSAFLKHRFHLLRQLSKTIMDTRGTILLEILLSMARIFSKDIYWTNRPLFPNNTPSNLLLHILGHLITFGIYIPIGFHKLHSTTNENKNQSIFFNYSGYDNLAHTYGEFSEPAKWALTSIDAQICSILNAALKANFSVIIFSDHGMTDCVFFDKINSNNLQGIISNLTQLPLRLIDEIPSHRTFSEKISSRSKFVIADCGPISLLYYRPIPHRLDRKEIDMLFPDLLKFLENTTGIGTLIVKSGKNFEILGPEGEVIMTPDGKQKITRGQNPLNKYGNSVELKSLIKWVSYNNQGDVVILGDYKNNKTVSFEDQIACHAGVGGDQNWPFYCCQAENDQLFRNLIN